MVAVQLLATPRLKGVRAGAVPGAGATGRTSTFRAAWCRVEAVELEREKVRDIVCTCSGMDFCSVVTGE